jgi:glycine cleavage system H protein
MNIPANLKYTKEHEWIKLDGNIATIGITDYAQGELGDIVFVELPAVGSSVAYMKAFGTIEAVKAVSDLFSPVTGKVTGVNAQLDNNPMVINKDAFGEGWMIKVECSNLSELEHLLTDSDYKGVLASA